MNTLIKQEPINPKADFPSEYDFLTAATKLNCDVNVIKAVAIVESSVHGGFITDTTSDGIPIHVPTLLYERHWFNKLTDRKHEYLAMQINKVNYFLAHPKGGGYGPVSIQHKKLAAAVKINRNAALMSCSWGLFQLMGFNFVKCGYSTLQSFINGMFSGVDQHLYGFVNLILNEDKKVQDKNGKTWTLLEAIRKKNFPMFKILYNGPKDNGYEFKMEKEFNGLSK